MAAVAANSHLESQGKYVQILNNKLVVRIYKLDNSKVVILVDPTATVEVCSVSNPRALLSPDRLTWSLRHHPTARASCCRGEVEHSRSR